MGRNWAIVVGINHYENLQPLKYAKRDAEGMRDWFEGKARFDQVFLFTENSPDIPSNQPIPTKPTYGSLRRFFRAQFENPLLQAGDNLWFFFAGHGKRDADRDYLMLSDSDPGDIEHSALSVSWITERLRRSGADNVVLFLDACRDIGAREGIGIGTEQQQGVITFYSCSPNQQSYEIEQLYHGSFTHALLESLQIEGEGNCATVERLYQRLRYRVREINQQYQKSLQTPYAAVEPATKLHLILLPNYATLTDINQLKLDAFQAEVKGDWELARQLWIRVNVAARGSDSEAIEAFSRISQRQGQPFTIQPNPKPPSSSTGGRGTTSEAATQREAQHQQNLVQYRQSFSQTIEQEFPLTKASRRQFKNLQQSLQLTDREVLQIEQPIIAPKEAEYQQQQERIRQQQEAETQRQQEEAARLKQQEAEKQRQREEAEYRQKLQQYEQTLIKIIRARNSLDSYDVRLRLKILQWTLGLKQADITAIETRIVASYAQPTQLIQQPITRQKFLKWAGLGGAGLVTAVVGREIFKNQVEFKTVTVDEKGQVIKQDANKQPKSFNEDLGNGVTLEMVSIPGGSFKMGSPSGEKKRSSDESPQHDVNVPAFYLGSFEVTQKQYQQVMGKNPSKFKGDKRPVEQVSWNEATEFCKKLSQKTGRKYRLPSEAEWEYACRAGTRTPFYFGETITTELANYDGTSTDASEPKGKRRGETTEVGSFPPNGFGLYDMHGNVWEWCQDTWHSSYEKASRDGTAWIDNGSEYRLLRGGSWYDNPELCRCAYRGSNFPDGSDYVIGFRVVCAGAVARTL